MWRRNLVPFLFVLVGWLGGSVSAEADCVPVVSGNRPGQNSTTHAQVYDGDLASHFNSTWSNWQWIQFDLQCLGRLQGVRRYMTHEVTQQWVPTGSRPTHQGEGFSYSVDGVAWTNLTASTTTGWQVYTNLAPHAWFGLPYGWSAWLRPLTPVQARYVRYNWDDDFDAVNEVELLFVEDSTPPSYEVVDLGALVVGGPFTAEAYGINKRGVVAGSYTSGGRIRAVLWDMDFAGHALARELETGCGVSCPRVSVAHDVNDHDEAVGYRKQAPFSGPTAAHWGLRLARPLPGQLTDSTSYAINNEGDITGTEFQFFGQVSSPMYAYRLHWEAARNGVLLDPSAYDISFGNDINDLGDVVGGYYDAASQRYRPFFYRSHRASGLAPQALSLEQGYNSGTASAISNARLIVGAQTTAAGVSHATVWRDGALLWTPTRLDAGVAGAALGVNDLGHVVGHHDRTTAVLWRDRSAYDLNQLIPAADQADWQLREARDINDRGEIVGVGTHQGRQTAFLLRPVREFEISPLDGAEEINDGGSIAGNTPSVGGWLRPRGAPRPVLLDAGGVSDINDSGVVAGWRPLLGAGLWSAPWSFLDLPAPGGVNSLATGVSSSGHAVGYLDLVNDRAFFWNERNMVSQPLVGGRHYLLDGNTSGEAVGKLDGEPTRWSQRLGPQTLGYNGFIDDSFEIDSRGFVVGTEDAALGTRAKLWNLTSALPTDLGALDIGIGNTVSARAINDRRQVVGHHSSSAGGSAAFLWEQDTMIDLNLLMPPGTPWELLGAHDINDAGQVLGFGRTPPGASSSTGFVLTLSSEAEAVTSLCRGWCEPMKRCGGSGANDIWTRPFAPNYTGCVNGCIAYAMDPARPHTLDQERTVRDCFLGGGQALCTQDWEQKTQQCCANQGLGSCNVYYP
jgi:probable HAF family extracellular repeat protein